MSKQTKNAILFTLLKLLYYESLKNRIFCKNGIYPFFKLYDRFNVNGNFTSQIKRRLSISFHPALVVYSFN